MRGGSAELAGRSANAILTWYSTRTNGVSAMISVAVRGYGIVIWERDGAWRTFSTTDAMSATLAARVEQALREVEPDAVSDETVCAALLTINGAHLMAVECDHGPGSTCGGDDARN